jgi:hypothetical protein
MARPRLDAEPEQEWRLGILSAIDGDDLFREARRNPVIRLLAFFANRKIPALSCGVLLIAAAVYCLMAPAGKSVGGMPAEHLTMALAASAIGIGVLVTLGAWLRPLESVDDAVNVMTVPLIVLEKGAHSDVH